MHPLDIPAGLDEFGGKPIEQFGVGWPGSLCSKVLGCFDDPGAEKLLPVTIHNHA